MTSDQKTAPTALGSASSSQEAAATINLAQGNRALGLLREVAEMIAEEGSSPELWRIEMTLRSLAAEARSKSQAAERATKQIARTARAQTASRAPMSKRISSLMARC